MYDKSVFRIMGVFWIIRIIFFFFGERGRRKGEGRVVVFVERI